MRTKGGELGKGGRRKRESVSGEGEKHWLNMELDLQTLFKLHVHSCMYSLAETIWAHMRGRYWSAKMDDISFVTPSGKGSKGQRAKGMQGKG